MEILSKAFGFFYWAGLTHFVNLLFIGFLIRSGLQILSAHPKLYWNDDCRLGSQWLTLRRKPLPSDRLWTSQDEEVSFGPVIALPGGYNLGMGRHWHFFCVLFWILNGMTYIGLLFATQEWRRLIPTSWEIFPQAWQAAVSYAHFHRPAPGHPYNALQQLAYAGVVFVLSPLMLATGAAMSPAIAGRFPWYIRLFGGRQAARSLHFLTLVAFLIFIVIHVSLVVLEDFGQNINWILHKHRQGPETGSILIALGGLVVVVLLHIWATRASRRSPRRVQTGLGLITNAARRLLGLHRLTSHQHYSVEDVSPFQRVNGRPPATELYESLAAAQFQPWKLEVSGLVATRLELSLEDLRRLPACAQITKHNCIQGWSYVAKWTGVSLQDILQRCRPLPGARFAVFHGFDTDAQGRSFYEVIDLALAQHSQSILAYALNDRPLPIPHGAPCRLRVETQLGFKMVKYLRAIELVESYLAIGLGQGGYREDVQFYDMNAGI